MKLLKFGIPVFLFFFLGLSPNKMNHLLTFIPSDTKSSEKAHQIDSLVSLYASYSQFNGSILVSENNEVLYKNGFGLANIEWNIPNKSTTKHRLASVSKQFTAAVILKLASEGKLDLNEHISSYLPEFPVENGSKITIHHLLTHTSGLPNYTSFADYRDNMKKSFTPEKLVSLFADSSLVFTPGERFEYSNSGYVLLGQIAEKIEGKSFDKILETHVLKPVGLKNTGMQKERKIIKDHSSGYNKHGSSFRQANYIDMSVAYTAGGIFSTVEDLYKWDQALYSEELFSQEWKSKLFEKHIPAWGDHYGYGWISGNRSLGNSDKKVKTIEHDGVINGYNSLFIRIPESHSSIIILSNVSGAPLNHMARQILGILYEKPYDFPKKSIPLTIAKYIQKSGLTNANETLKTLLESSEYYNEENDMNLVGYEFLENGQLDEAEFIFRINKEQFPQSSNVYDSYGEVLLKLGNKSEAVEHYKKSILLNPRNAHGKEVLSEQGISPEEIENLTLELLESELKWQNEIFHFPLRFASEIPYKGREDARFPPGWRSEKSGEFWSYVFAWYIDKETDVSKEEIENNVEMYFDGLMGVVNRNPNITPDATVANFKKSKTPKNIMKGTIDIYDAFVTNKKMRLYSKVEQYKIDDGKSILLFRFSPKEYDDSIWMELQKFNIRSKIYDY